MDDNTQGVNSTGSPSVDTSADNVTLPEDRPAQNLKAEFDRKYGSLQTKVDAVLNWIQSQAAQPTPQQSQPTEVTDEELWQEAQRGNRQAFEAYQLRMTDRRINQQSRAASYARSVDQQLAAIMNKYPVLQDANHPLTQTANLAYALLLQQGYPSNRATLLEAAKTAIADRPDLVSELHGSVGTQQTRRTASQMAQSGAMGATHRQDSTPAQTKALTPAEADLARRMGVKDPNKSKERFLQRQQGGVSSVSPTIGVIAREEDL